MTGRLEADAPLMTEVNVKTGQRDKIDRSVESVLSVKTGLILLHGQSAKNDRTVKIDRTAKSDLIAKSGKSAQTGKNAVIGGGVGLGAIVLLVREALPTTVLRKTGTVTRPVSFLATV